MIHSSCHAVDDPSAETVIEAPIEVKQDSATRGGLLRIANLRATQGMVVDSNNFERVDLCKVHVSQEPGRDDCLVINDCTGKQVLLDDCEVYGGGDGLGHYGRSTKLHVKNSAIRFAQSRGIFANDDFVIEDSEVSNCGGYGIKMRGGCTYRGDNDIQPGPWDGMSMGGFF